MTFPGLRSTLAAVALLAGGTSLQAAPITYNFSGSDAGGTGSATMIIDVTGNTLTATLSNTSPTTLDDGTGVNTPGITGFGFNLSDPIPGILSWSITAFLSDKTTVAIIGDSSGAGTWIIDGTIGGMTLDVLACDDDPNCDAVQGALYNPAATSGFGAPPNYFTDAVLTMLFDGAPEVDAFIGDGNCNQPDPCSPFVRFQNVGLNGEGSLRLPGTPDDRPPQQIPEPGALVLLGLGLAAMGAVCRRRMMASR